MRLHIIVSSITELMLIATLSGGGIYAFINSGIYSLVDAIIILIIHHIPIIQYIPIPIILWGLLFVFGVFSITFRGHDSGKFVWLVTLLSLPSLLSFNIVNWLSIFGLEFKLSTNISFYEMLGLGVLIITGYIVLSHLYIFKQTRHNLTNRGANPIDIESVTFNSYLVLILAIASALVTATAIAFLSRNLELLILDYIKDMPWNVIFIGPLCILLIAAYLYWLGARRRPKD